MSNSIITNLFSAASDAHERPSLEPEQLARRVQIHDVDGSFAREIAFLWAQASETLTRANVEFWMTFDTDATADALPNTDMPARVGVTLGDIFTRPIDAA